MAMILFHLSFLEFNNKTHLWKFKRLVREHYMLLIEKLKKKLKEEKKAIGIETDMSDVEKALEEITEKEADAKNSLEVDKKKKE